MEPTLRPNRRFPCRRGAQLFAMTPTWQGASVTPRYPHPDSRIEPQGTPRTPRGKLQIPNTGKRPLMNTDDAKRCQQAQHGYWEFESKPSPRSPLPVGEGLEVRVRSLPISDYLWLICPEFGFWLSGFSYCALWPLCFNSVSLCLPNRDYGIAHGR